MERVIAENKKLKFFMSFSIVVGLFLSLLGILIGDFQYAKFFYFSLFFFLLITTTCLIGFQIHEHFYFAFNTPAILLAITFFSDYLSVPLVFLSSMAGDYLSTLYKKRYSLFLHLFNGATSAISAFLSLIFFKSFYTTINLQYLSSPEFFLILLGTVFIYEFANSLFVSAAYGLQEGFKFYDIFLSISVFRLIVPTLANLMLSAFFVWAFMQFEYKYMLYGVFGFFLVASIYQREVRMDEMRTEMVMALLETLGARDEHTKNHSIRISELGVQIAKEMKLPYRTVKQVKFSALLHDLGKINFPDKAFTQKHIDTETWEVIKRHPQISHKILEHLADYEDITRLVELHHERYDGSGYPNKLSGEDIPVVARILAVCDSFDAMTSNRAYRRALPLEYAIKEIRDYRGKAYDPVVVDIFVKVIYRMIREMKERYRKEELANRFAIRRYQ